MRAALLAMMLLLLVVQGSANAEQERLLIGMDIPLTGSGAGIGQFLVWGARAAVDEANAAGGVRGKLVELRVLDDETDAQIALENVKRLVEQERVAAVLGPANSGNALVLIPYLQERRVPNMLLTASATVLTKLYQGPDNYIFRVTLPDGEQLKMLATWAAKKFKRIGVAADATQYGRITKEDFTKALAAFDVAPVECVEFELGELDMTEQARLLKTRNVDGVAIFSLGQEIAAMVRSADTVGLRPTFFGLHPFFLPAIEQLPTRLSNGLVGISGPSPQDSPKAAELDRVVRERFGWSKYYPFKFLSVGYEGAKLLIQAMTEAESLDGPTLRKALENVTRFEGIARVFHNPFSAENHELYTADDLYFSVWKNGSIYRFIE